MTHQALLWAFHWPEGETSAQCVEQPESLLAREGLRWLHLQCDAPGAEELLIQQELPQGVIDALLAPETRPRSFALQGGTLVLLRGINKNPGAEPDDMISLRIWFNHRVIITARKQQRRLYSVQELREKIEQGSGPATSHDFVVQLIEGITNRVHQAVEEMEDELSSLELEVENQSKAKIRQELTLLRRQAASIRRYLAPQREALEALQRQRGLFADQELFHLREQTDRTTRYVEEIELLRERAVMLQDELRNQVAEQQNMRMYILSLITAIFLPLSFLTGVFGMNVAGLPGTEEPQSFYLLAGGMAIIGLTIWGVMRWRRWFV